MSNNPLEFCTYVDNEGKVKFLTDFIPQVIAVYEMELRRNLDGNYPGAVYNAMETALTQFFLTPVLAATPAADQPISDNRPCAERLDDLKDAMRSAMDVNHLFSTAEEVSKNSTALVLAEIALRHLSKEAVTRQPVGLSWDEMCVLEEKYGCVIGSKTPEQKEQQLVGQAGCISCGHRFDGHWPQCRYFHREAQEPVGISDEDTYYEVIGILGRIYAEQTGSVQGTALTKGVDAIRHLLRTPVREAIDRWKLAKWLYDNDTEVDKDGVQLRPWETMLKRHHDAYYHLAGECIEAITQPDEQGRRGRDD